MVAVIAVVATAVGIWAALRGPNAKRRLLYSMPTVAPLINDSPNLGSRLEVRFDGKILSRPQVVVLQMAAQGRQDILRADFNDEPIVLDLGVDIMGLLTVVSIPEDSPLVPVAVSGQTLRLGPGLIHRNQAIAVSVLVDGAPELTPPRQTLSDVRVRLDTRNASDSIIKLVLESAVGSTSLSAIVRLLIGR
ncbi:hypothetical protein ABH935_008607 [Catenulispora sp. GAS73]|uniref:hypothetical protein n=1 Tax=Catenulispora sp. GAS73 TaxID=3156269 RepID=UPI0035117A81